MNGSASPVTADRGLKPVYMKAFCGFLLMVTDDGEVIYISENVEEYLGILQVF